MVDMRTTGWGAVNEVVHALLSLHPKAKWGWTWLVPGK